MTRANIIDKLKAPILLIVSPLMIAFVFQARLPAGLVAETSELIFDHVRHVEDEGLVCDDCHSGVESSASGLDNLLPNKDVCSDCHEVDDEAECGTCHSNVDEAKPLTPITDYSEKFTHEGHLGTGLECQDCHAAVLRPVDPVVGAVGALPTMINCVDCHEQKSASLECSTCHMPSEDLRPVTHAADFLRVHGVLARADAHDALDRMQCQTCHQESYCQDCHEGDNLDRLTHPLNYQFTHALDARGQERACVTCHADPVFCADCHIDNQVLPQNHRPGWSNTIDGGMHRFEAAADLNSCISCHQDNADQVCQPCHGPN